MLKTRIQLPAVWGGQPTDWMRSLAVQTQQYAEQSIVPAVCAYYEGLPSVAEKMHFEPLEYRHIWHTQPQPNASDLLAVRIESTLARGDEVLSRAVYTVTVDGETGRLVRGRAADRGYIRKKKKGEARAGGTR